MTTRVIIAIFVIASTLALVLSAGEVKSTFFDVTSTVARSKWDTLDSAKKTSFLGFLEQIHNSYHIDNYGKNFTIQEFQRKIENNEITQEEINLMVGNASLFHKDYNYYVVKLFNITAKDAAMTEAEFCKEVPKICDNTYVLPVVAPNSQISKTPDNLKEAPALSAVLQLTSASTAPGLTTTLKPLVSTMQNVVAEAAKAEGASSGHQNMPLILLYPCLHFLAARL